MESWKRAGEAESEQRGNENDQSQDLESLVNNLTDKDVEGYFRTLSFEEAMALACRCCASALKISKEQLVDPSFVDEIGIQGLIIRKMKKQEVVYHELIHSDIMKKAMRLAVEI